MMVTMTRSSKLNLQKLELVSLPFSLIFISSCNHFEWGVPIGSRLMFPLMVKMHNKWHRSCVFQSSKLLVAVERIEGLNKWFNQLPEGNRKSKFSTACAWQQFAGINGFLRLHELWFFKVQKYCCTLLLLVLNLKMKALILEITGREWCKGMLGPIWWVAYPEGCF